MCGIVGYATSAKNPSSITQEIARNVEKTLEVMRLRGPDDSGMVRNDNCLLAHTRLAILDPESGKQPWIHRETGTCLTYNGEIYNFRDLRQELTGKGYVFKTECDTEVVMAAYLEWQEACVQKFNGFFAFAVYDPRNQCVFAARDRLGIKPFYYTADHERFVFSSTIPACLIAASMKKDLDLETLSHYLSTGKTVFGDKTLFQGIYKLPPAHWMRYDLRAGTLKRETYWKRPVLTAKQKNKLPLNFEQAVTTTRELLEDAVRMRLVSDVPLGSFLSGGLDSSIIAYSALKYSNLPVPFYCAGTDDEKSNEFEYARQLSNHLKADLQEVVITPDKFSNDWAFLIGNKGEPLSTPNEISIYHLAKTLKKQCTVTLTGEGADEVFGGYIIPQFSAFDYDRCSHDPEHCDNSSAFAMAMVLLHGRCFFINDTDHYTATSTWFSYLEKIDLFQEGVWQQLDDDNAFFAFYENFFNKVDKCTSFDKRMHLHAEFNLENLLARIDNCTMSASVEARVPFNDHRLIEHAFSMPDPWKMDWLNEDAEKAGRGLTTDQIDKQNLLESKRLLRHAFADVLPNDIVSRKKMSFPVPYTKWFSETLRDEIRELCLESSLTKTYFNQPFVDILINSQHRNLWLVANLCKWWDVVQCGTA